MSKHGVDGLVSSQDGNLVTDDDKPKIFKKFLHNQTVVTGRKVILMTNEKLANILAAQVREMHEDDIVYLWNEYAYDCRPDDVIYENTEDVLDEIFRTPSEAIRAIYFGNYTFNDPYMFFNGYANLESIYSVLNDENSIFYMDELVEWLIEDDRYTNYDFDVDDEDDDE